MIDNNNILLITDYEDVAKSVLEKLILLRDNDHISVCNVKNTKKMLQNSLYSIVILHETDDENYTIKLISTIKEIKSDTEIILLLNNQNPRLVLSAYDNGIFDYFTMDSSEYDILIKTVNCFKMRTIKDIASRNEKFLYQHGIIDSKTNLYHYKYLKDVFYELSDEPKIQNGIFAVVTLDGSSKTKISLNRLSTAIKSCVRMDDIIAVGKAGKYYLIIPNIDVMGAKDVVNKIQERMGDEFNVRAGFAKIGTNSFDTLDKNATDSLTAAIRDEVTALCLEETSETGEAWLEDDENPLKKKDFKLFRTIFKNKLDNTITPIFYRQHKDCESKLKNTIVSQYANDIECVFSLKNKNTHSELTIRYNGYAKFKIEITHSGLDSAENTKLEIPLKDLTDKYLLSLLKQLRDEYKQTAYEKGNNDA